MSDKPVYSGNSIMIRPNGPLICKSDMAVVVCNHLGDELHRSQDVALCRCGASANKPYCDGSHNGTGFNADQEFTDERAEDIHGQTGELSVTVKEQAMLSITGPFTLFSRSGKSVTTRTRGALCRCGQSGKKPFCDGSHKKSGFTG